MHFKFLLKSTSFYQKVTVVSINLHNRVNPERGKTKTKIGLQRELRGERGKRRRRGKRGWWRERNLSSNRE